MAGKGRRTPAVTELLLYPARVPPHYQPGQYVLFGDTSSELAVRSYSIANAPGAIGLLAAYSAQLRGAS